MFFVFFSFISLSTSVLSDPLNGLAFLDHHVNKVLQCHGLASLTLTVVKDGETVLHRGYGFADVAKQTPVDKDTLYAVGSLSKGFTSFLLEYYQENGLLSLEEPIAKQMREAGRTFRFSVGSYNESYNMKDLLSHRTGLSSYMGFEFMSNLTRAQLFEDLYYSEEDNTEPYRNSFVYNNWLYATAARAGEVMSGKVYEREVEKLIFSNLGMKAGFANDEEFIARNKERIAKPYFYQSEQNLLVQDNVWEVVGAFSPAGGVMTSGADMAKWMKFLLNGGIINAKKRLVETATIENMFTQLNEQCSLKRTFPWNSDCIGYGEGWFLFNCEGSPEYGHTGNYFNVHRSKISIFPEKNLGIFYAFSGGKPISGGKNMFDVLDPVIVDTIVNGSFDTDKYNQINDEMEKWGCHTAGSAWNHFGGSESDPGTAEVQFAPDLKGIPIKPAPSKPPQDDLVLAELRDEYLGVFNHPFLGKAEMKYDEDGIPRFILSDAWQSRLYESRTTHNNNATSLDNIELCCFFDGIPWLPTNVEDSDDNKMVIMLRRSSPSSSSTPHQPASSSTPHQPASSTATSTPRQPASSTDAVQYNYLDITWFIRYTVKSITFTRVKE